MPTMKRCNRCKHEKELDAFKGDNGICIECSDKLKAHHQKYIDAGRCSVCGRTPLATPKMCRICTIRAIESTNKIRHGIIEELLNKQNGKCVLSGLPLIVGKNLSVDHIKPRCEFDNLKDAGYDSNLRLLDRRINAFAASAPDSELFEFCIAVVKHNDLM